MWTARYFVASILMSALSSVALWMLAAAYPAQAANPRGVALVIGNAKYAHAGELANPKNDADDVATAFEAIGYRVIKGIDLDKREMERTIGEFARALQNADAGVLFYAGHGIQVEGRNYLVPVDARLEDATGVDFELVQLATVQRVMERSVKTNVIFLDACRNNPLARNLARAMGTRSAGAVGRGLASTEAGVGTLISFSTQPGNVALDGTGRNSPYSGALAKNIVGAQSDLSDVLINVRRDVMAATERRQVPWEHSALTDRFYFKPRPADAVASAIASAATPDFALQAEMAFWTAVRDSGQVALLESYLSRYPQGRFAAHARKSIEDLKQKEQTEKQASKQGGQNAVPASPTVSGPSSPQATTEFPFDGVWQLVITYTVPTCARKNARFPVNVAQGAVTGGPLMRGGSVDSTGNIRFERQALANAGVKLRFVGTLTGNSGTGHVEAIGRACRGTVTFVRVSGAATQGTAGTTTGLSVNTALPRLPTGAVETAQELQRELQRVGCYTGTIDGDWGSGSKQAMTDFNTHTNMAFQTEEPTGAAILAIKKVFARICPAAAQVRPASITPSARSAGSARPNCRMETRDECASASSLPGTQCGRPAAEHSTAPSNRRRICR